MEALLPSEIARLVFGYLEDQKCDIAARSFLEASPHLQECRTAVLSGRRFNTRVNGYTLVDIFDKFSAAQCLVHEKLSRVEDSDQVRQCGDLLEQLRFLIGGSRGQRFVVNINVPSQANSQTYVGSPIITSSIRKRHHSGSDRDRTKRTQKPLHPLLEKEAEPVSSHLGCVTVEATPLESLPGHTNLIVPRQHSHAATEDSDHVYCTSNKSGFVDCPLLGDLQSVSTQICDQPPLSDEGNGHDNSRGRSEGCSPVSVHEEEKIDRIYMDNKESRNSLTRGKTMATSTDELTTYSSIEVQTTPYALSESESIGLDDEPIENLSLLTKELLNRTELQERIAENINKAILPIEMPSKDDSICESIGGELNTSIMAELNNAIKSIVAATETDPIFEHFLDEIIGPSMDTDTSPDEEPDVRVTADPPTNSRINNISVNTDVVNMDMDEVTTVMSNTIQNSIDSTEVPLKQRLRSSSKQQNTKVDDEGNKVREVDKEDISLEDHNAAAIMSIINANIVNEKQVIDNVTISGNNVISKKSVDIESTEMLEASSIFAKSQAVDRKEVVQHDPASCRSVEVPTAKKSVCTKSHPETDVDQQELITEQEMMAMPTLIVCSQEEMRDCNHAGTLDSSVTTVPCPEARFVSIAPKGPEVMGPLKPIYLRAVHVPVRVPDKIQAASSTTGVKLIGMEPQSPPKISSTKRKRNHRVTKKSKNLKPVVIETKSPVNSESSSVQHNATSRSKLEPITLYANDNSFGAMIESGHMPAINLDDAMTLTDTGLSTYLKFHDDKSLLQQSALVCEKPPNQVLNVELGTVPIVLGHDDSILITRRTPQSLLKSRSKHNRISMSTPRRRSNHIRALDFNTPTKSSTSEHKLGRNNSLQLSSKSSKSSKRTRSVCRTSLFKSPLFSKSIIVSPKRRTPEKDCQSYKIPIATRSPAPKLMGDWEKYTGVEMILGGTSPHPSSSALLLGKEELKTPIETTSCSYPTVKKSWDADLRQALQKYQAPLYTTLATTKEMARSKGEVENCSTDLVKQVSESGDTKIDCDLSKHTIISHPQETVQAATQGVCAKIDNGPWENIPSTPSEAKCDSDKLKRVELTLVVDNLELDVSHGAQIADLEIQGKLAPTDMKEQSGNDTELQVDVTPQIEDIKKISVKPVVKKYAEMKTLESKISRSKKGRITRSKDPYIVDYSQKKCEYFKVSPESQSRLVHTSCMIDLETPRKTDNSAGIPPTPRLLSPSSNTITPFAKVPEGISRVPSFVNTPDFPPTPSIALTPNVMGENMIDAIKKKEYSTGSPYYQPSTERPDILEKLIDDSHNSEPHETGVLPVTLPVDIDTSAVTKRGGNASDFVMTISNSTLEITQFEVIKENLPKEEAVKQLKISAHPINVQDTSSAITKLEEISHVGNISKSSPNDENTRSSSGNESSDSTSSNSSSSSSCSTTCSCSSIATTSTPLKFQNKCKTESNIHRVSRNDRTSESSLVIATHNNLLTEISPIIAPEIRNMSKNNQTLIAVQTPSSVPKGEISPVKLLPFIKSLEEVDTSVKETPAKDEALLSEANISETPSSSKSGIESLTNLNSKISALNSLGDQDGNPGHGHSENKIEVALPTSPKPEVLSVQHLLPDVSVASKTPVGSEMVSRTTPPFNNLSMLSSVALDGKLGTHLKEKRLRLMAKMKNKPQPKLMSRKTKVKQLNLNVMKYYKDKNDMLKSSTREQKSCTNQAACRNSTMKKVHLGPEKRLVNDKNTEIKRKQKSQSNSHRNEKDERSTVNLVELSSKETDDECNTTESVVKPTNINRQQTSDVRKVDCIESSNENKITRLDDQQDIQNPKEHSCADLLVAQLHSKDFTMLSVDSPETVADLKAINKMMKLTCATDPTSSFSHKCDPTCAPVDTTEHIKTVDKEFPRSFRRRTEDGERDVENVMNPMKKSQIVPMFKVDLIKRDLFSDEENSDQRTTRSRARQLSDAQRNEPVLNVSESAAQSRAEIHQVITKKSGEELASVLECLKLVPAIKYDVADQCSSSPKPSMNKFAEYEFVYDDSIRVKKKTIKFSSTDLRYRINVELRDENYRECSKLMTATAYGEIFNISPKSKKRLIAKKLLINNCKPREVEAVERSSTSGRMSESGVMKPLAPAASFKTPISEAEKSISQLQREGIDNQSFKDDNKKPEDTKQMLKKRKTIDLEEDHSGVKRQRIADPQTLLKKLNLDLFLNTVHGPV